MHTCDFFSAFFFFKEDLNKWKEWKCSPLQDRSTAGGAEGRQTRTLPWRTQTAVRHPHWASSRPPATDRQRERRRLEWFIQITLMMWCDRLFSGILWGIPPGCEWWLARLCLLSSTRCLGIQAEWSPAPDPPPSSRSCWDSPRPAAASPSSGTNTHSRVNEHLLQLFNFTEMKILSWNRNLQNSRRTWL